MKTSQPSPLVAPAVLLVLVAAAALAGRALALPVPAVLAVLTLVLLGLRVGVMFAAARTPAAPARSVELRGEHRAPALRAANG